MRFPFQCAPFINLKETHPITLIKSNKRRKSKEIQMDYLRIYKDTKSPLDVLPSSCFLNKLIKGKQRAALSDYKSCRLRNMASREMNHNQRINVEATHVQDHKNPIEGKQPALASVQKPSQVSNVTCPFFKGTKQEKAMQYLVRNFLFNSFWELFNPAKLLNAHNNSCQA